MLVNGVKNCIQYMGCVKAFKMCIDVAIEMCLCLWFRREWSGCVQTSRKRNEMMSHLNFNIHCARPSA